jgi:hypothetical protein
LHGLQHSNWKNQHVDNITGEITISDHTIITDIKVIFLRNVSPKKRALSCCPYTHRFNPKNKHCPRAIIINRVIQT